MGGHPGISSTAGGVSLDTSGAVRVVAVYRNGRPGTIRVHWDDLSPFEQGYVEAMLSGTTKPFALGCTYRRRDGRTVRIKEREDTYIHHAWVRGDDPSENAPEGICRYNRASDRGRVTGSAFDMSDPRNLIPENVAFSDLAPETLAAIRKDCGRMLDIHAANTEANGRAFWIERNSVDGALVNFRPLAVTLGDEGKVRTSPVDGTSDAELGPGKTQTPTPSLGTQEEQDR